MVRWLLLIEPSHLKGKDEKLYNYAGEQNVDLLNCPHLKVQVLTSALNHRQTGMVMKTSCNIVMSYIRPSKRDSDYKVF
jgi:hypothetical protein